MGVRTNSAAKARTEAREARSRIAGMSLAVGTSARMRAMASSDLAAVRAGRTISAPLRASSRAVFQPMPLLAPVMIARRLVWEGMFAGEKAVFGVVFRVAIDAVFVQ